MMGDLPKARLTPYEPPFTYTGLDLFGPFYVKRGRGTEKVYDCIFVRFTTRAIHIEDVGSLEADDFIQALRRFICTRGAAKEIWSDNGTNFVGGEKEIRLAIQGWNQKAIIEALHERGVEWHSQPLKKWHFQPPTASHMSGVWERLIRSVRKTMKAIIGIRTPLSSARRCVQCSQKQLVFSTADLFVQAAKIRTIVNQSHQVISYNNGKVSQYLLVYFKTQKSILESSGAEDKFWPTTFGRVGFVNIFPFCKKERSG